MKKLITLFVLLPMALWLNAQNPQIHNVLPDNSKEHIANPMQLHHAAQDNLPVHNKKTDLLNKKSTTWQWDTIIAYKVGMKERHIQTFDVKGNILTLSVEQWQTNTWVNSVKQTYTYDANGNRLTELDELWQNNTWVNSVKQAYTYDANGNRLTELHEYWQNNVWVNGAIYTYTYDTNNNRLTKLIKLWQSNVWVNYERCAYTYDANGNRLTELYEDWQSNTWVKRYRSTYTYDVNDNMLSGLYELWQPNVWGNSGRYTYTYDANGNRLTQLYEDWQNNTWVNGYRSTCTYDANGNMLTNLGEDWESNAWGNNTKLTYTYDTNGNSLTGKYEEWFGSWQPSLGALYVYSNDIPMYYLWDFDSYEASYISFNTGIADIQINSSCFVVYPNPSNGLFTISITGISNAVELSITNLQGQEVYKEQLNTTPNYTKQLDISNYPKGIYFLKLTGEDVVETEKIIVY